MAQFSDFLLQRRCHPVNAGKYPYVENAKMLLTKVAAALAFGLTLYPSPLLAAEYPEKQIAIVVPLPPGGAADIFARAIGERLRQVWGHSVIIENKDGANTQIGAAYVSKAPADGYTLLLTPEFTMTVAPTLHRRMQEVTRSLVPISGIAAAPLALVVKPKLQARDLNEFLAMANGEPGRLTFAVPGTGSTSHLAMEILQSRSKTKMTAVAYRGAAPAISDIMAGHVDAMMVAVGLVKELSSAGQLRLLGVGSSKRLSGAPDVPTISETLPNFEANIWFGLFAPNGVSAEIITKLNLAVQKLLVEPEFSARYLAANSYEPLIGSPDSLSAIIKKETSSWSEIIRSSGLAIAE